MLKRIVITDIHQKDNWYPWKEQIVGKEFEIGDVMQPEKCGFVKEGKWWSVSGKLVEGIRIGRREDYRPCCFMSVQFSVLGTEDESG